MSDFSRPEYKSYIELCRELALPREWQNGDQVIDPYEIKYELGPSLLQDYDLIHQDSIKECIWLPSLSDWLDMLEEAGEDFIAICPGYEIFVNDGMGVEKVAIAPTREEAAARLWMEVRNA